MSCFRLAGAPADRRVQASDLVRPAWGRAARPGHSSCRRLELPVPEAAAEGYEDQAERPRGLGRLMENLGRVPGPYGTPVVDPAEENRYRSETEEFLAGPRRPVESWSAARYCSTILLLHLYL